MSISNAKCKKCGDIESQDHDFNRNGLWICSCKSKKVARKDGKKPLDIFVEEFKRKTVAGRQ